MNKLIENKLNNIANCKTLDEALKLGLSIIDQSGKSLKTIQEYMRYSTIIFLVNAAVENWKMPKKIK